jgi:hypothetical protein
MAQIIHITTPHNSGNGDPLATAMENQNSMNTELYTTKVDKVGGKGLSDTNFSQAEKDKLALLNTAVQPQVQADMSVTNPLSLAYVANQPTKTSDFINDGDGAYPFITAANIPPASTVITLTFPRLTVAQQDFEIPLGKIAKQAFVNGAIWYLNDANLATEPNTFTQSGTTVTFKTTQPIGKLIVIYIQ